jgi:MFS family permease
MRQFDETAERARALALYSCIGAGGGSAGVVLGGMLTNELSWRWIFLINVPIGAIVYTLCRVLRFQTDQGRRSGSFDVVGAVTITASLTLAIDCVLNAELAGWGSVYTLAPLCTAVVFAATFLINESRVQMPIIPMTLFEIRNFRVSVIVGALWEAAHYTWFFISALYLQFILGYDALRVGLAFLPATLFMALFSFGLSVRLIVRFGTKVPLTLGLVLVASGLALLARAPVNGNFPVDVLPGMLLVGLGCGIASNPFMLGALSDVFRSEYGLASGLVNSSTVLGGSFALALNAGLAAARTNRLIAGGISVPLALNEGYHLAFIASAAFAFAAALVSGFGLVSRNETRTSRVIKAE